jgi:hypothetical protein
MPPNNVKPNVMHLLDVTVNNETQELNMSKFQIVNLREGRDEADAVNVSQLTNVEKKFDEELVGVKASIISGEHRIGLSESQIAAIQAVITNSQSGNAKLDNRLDSLEGIFGSGIDGVKGDELLRKIKEVYLLIDGVADSDIASTLTKLFNTDVELDKKIKEEKERAVLSEENLLVKINEEVVARTTQDGMIRLDFAAADKVIEKELSDAVKAEADRAKAAEADLLKKVVDETTRATGAEADLTTLIDGNRIYSDEQDAAISKELDDEFKRATLAEAELLKKVEDETDRAKAAEADLLKNVEDETTRAKGVEADLKTLIDENKNYSAEQDATLDIKIENTKILLDLEDAKIRGEIESSINTLKDEFNGVLNSTNENLSSQIKNVADTLASLLTKLFGKNEQFTAEFIIKESVQIE